jgi:hypothetical protein
VHPLDGGALSRVGNALTGERARGGAAAVFFSGRHGRHIPGSGALGLFLWAREKKGRKRKNRGEEEMGATGGLGRAALRRRHRQRRKEND